MRLLQQRITTLERNAFGEHERRSVNRSKRVSKLGYWFDICMYLSIRESKLIEPIVAACNTFDLCRLWRLYILPKRFPAFRMR